MIERHPLAVSSIEYAGLADLIENVCGVHYRLEDRAILAAKLDTLALDLGYASVLDYYDRLRHDDPELQKLVEAILVHETYFFRELPPLAQLVDGHLKHIVHSHGRARVWSAGCSTGEEPLTLAMLLADRGLLGDVEIVASDVSGAAITRAVAGNYGSRSLRDGHPAALATTYLAASSDALTVAPRIHDAVQYETVNLLDDDGVRRLGTFDAILCRNVLMYFREDRIDHVISRLARSLRASGLIAVGVAESLLRFGAAVTCEERGGAYFYRSAR